MGDLEMLDDVWGIILCFFVLRPGFAGPMIDMLQRFGLHCRSGNMLLIKSETTFQDGSYEWGRLQEPSTHLQVLRSPFIDFPVNLKLPLMWGPYTMYHIPCTIYIYNILASLGSYVP